MIRSKVFKLPRKLKTVDDLLTQNDILEILDKVQKHKGEMEEVVVIWSDGDEVKWLTSPMLHSRLFYLFDKVKISEITGEEKGE